MEEGVYKTGLSQKQLKRPGRWRASLGNAGPDWTRPDRVREQGCAVEACSCCQCPPGAPFLLPARHSPRTLTRQMQQRHPSTEGLTRNHQRTRLPSGEHGRPWVGADTEESMFACSQCGKGFLQSSALALHWRPHSRDKAFPWGTRSTSAAPPAAAARSPSSAVSVARLSAATHLSWCTSASTPARSLTDAPSVARPSARTTVLPNTRRFTPERRLRRARSECGEAFRWSSHPRNLSPSSSVGAS